MATKTVNSLYSVRTRYNESSTIIHSCFQKTCLCCEISSNAIHTLGAWPHQGTISLPAIGYEGKTTIQVVVNALLGL